MACCALFAGLIALLVAGWRRLTGSAPGTGFAPVASRAAPAASDRVATAVVSPANPGASLRPARSRQRRLVRAGALAGALLAVAAGAHAWTHTHPATGGCALPFHWQAWLYVAR